MLDTTMIGHRKRMVAAAITPEAAGTVVTARRAGGGSAGRHGDERSCHRIAVQPDVVAARRWKQAVRRIDRVEICQNGPAVGATVYGVGHRRDIARPVSVATALGLGLLGVPLVMDVEAR